MASRLYVGTRKGLFVLERHGDDWRPGASYFVGDPVTMMLPDPRDGAIYCALKLGHFGPKLRRSDDGGRHWRDCVEPRFPMASNDAGDPAPAVMQIWALEAGGADEPGVLWAGAIPAGLFRSQDRGESWQLVQTLWQRPERGEWFGGGYDEPGIHSICVDPRDSSRVTVGISCGGVWQTGDSGATWACRATGMRAAYMPTERAMDPNIQDPHRVVQCPAAPEVLWSQHHNGIFRSTDGAASWHELTGVAPSAFGFACAVHPQDPDEAWFVPAVKDEIRVPVDGALVVTHTRDGGRSFELLTDGLPQRDCYDLVYRHALDIDPAGETLAMGSTTGNLWISNDRGAHWRNVAIYLPPIYCLRFAT